MGIYDRGLKLDFQFSYAKAKKATMGAAVIAAAALAIYGGILLAKYFEPQPLAFWFEGNAAELSGASQTFLFVRVTNTGNEELRNVTLTATAVDGGSLFVSASPIGSNAVAVLGRGENRIIKFLVDPRSGILPGEYSINIKASSGLQEYASATAAIKIV